ncbi:MAG: hypothetical protein HYR67_00780, partial [Bacteroidetes bacterium]|nr:hypothetical protein [Bacteroidota bacterium]
LTPRPGVRKRPHVLAAAKWGLGLPGDLAGFVHTPACGLVRGRKHGSARCQPRPVASDRAPQTAARLAPAQ